MEGGTLAKYVIPVNYTEQGIAKMKDSRERLQAVRASIEEAGGKMESFYLTLGQYDVVSIVDVPDDATLATLLLKTAANGNVRTSTLRAFDETEYVRIIDAL